MYMYNVNNHKDTTTTTTKQQQRNKDTTTTTTTNRQQRTTKHNSGTAPQQQHAGHTVSGDNYNNYKDYNNNTTLIYGHLRHTELLRLVHPFAGDGTASQPLPALRNLVRRAAAVYSGRESFIVCPWALKAKK